MAGKADIKAGRAFVELFLKNNIKRGLDQASKQLKSFGMGAMRMGAQVAGVGASVAGAFIAPIKAASDMQETMSKFNTVFGESAGRAKKWGDEFAGQVGRSKAEIAGFLASSQDLFVPLGFEPGAAEDLSKQITTLAVDLASFNNMADADAMNDLHAALTGSGETMKKYGVVLNEAAVKQELLNQGLDPKTVTEATKAQARLNIIMAGTAAAQGDATRTAGSFANRMKALKANISDTAVTVGEALLPMVTDFATKAGAIIVKIAKWAEQNQELIRVIFKVALGVAAAGGAIAAFGAIAFTVGSAMGGLAMIASGALVAFKLLISPIGLVTAALAGGIYVWARYTESGQAAMKGLASLAAQAFGTIKETWGGVVDALMAGDLERAGKIAVTGLRLMFAEGLQSITDMIGGNLGAAIGHLGGKLLRGDLQGIWDSTVLNMTAIWDSFVSGIVSSMKSAIDVIGKMWTDMISRTQATLGTIGAALRVAGFDSAADATSAARGAIGAGGIVGTNAIGAVESAAGAVGGAMNRRAMRSGMAVAGDFAQGAGANTTEIDRLRAELNELTRQRTQEAKEKVADGLNTAGRIIAGEAPIGKGQGAFGAISSAAAMRASGVIGNPVVVELKKQEKNQKELVKKMDRQIMATEKIQLQVVG